MTTSLALKSQDDVIASLAKLLDIKPDTDDASYNEGNKRFKLGRYEEAIASYDTALKIQPDFPEAWYNRSIALLYLGRFEEVINSFDQTTQIQSDFPEAWSNRGFALSQLGRYEEAIASINKALELKDDLHEPWSNRGFALYRLGRLDEAIASFDKALNIKPDLHEVWYNKACCYAIQGNLEQAIENLQQAINLSPEKYREMANTDSDFDSIRENERFQALLQEEDDEEKDVSELRHNVSWEEFENILAELGDNRSLRVAYDQGTLEITMPSQKHEYYKEIIRDLIKYLAEELDLDCESLGSTTWKRKDLLKGAEPDNCFYIQNEPAIRAVKPNIDLSKDPPPDLILEVDYTSPSLNRLPIYAGLGVPEIWIYNMLAKRGEAQILRVYQLEAEKYKETDTSFAFGTFPLKEIPNFINKNIKASPRELRQSFRAWVRQYLTESLH